MGSPTSEGGKPDVLLPNTFDIMLSRWYLYQATWLPAYPVGVLSRLPPSTSGGTTFRHNAAAAPSCRATAPSPIERAGPRAVRLTPYVYL